MNGRALWKKMNGRVQKTKKREKNKTEMFFFLKKAAVYWKVCLQPHAELGLRLLCCLSYLVWLMALPYCSHPHRSISLVQYSLDQDHLAGAQKAKVDVQTLGSSRTKKKMVLVKRCAKRRLLTLRIPSVKHYFWNRRESTKGSGRPGQTHAVNSEWKRDANNETTWNDQALLEIEHCTV